MRSYIWYIRVLDYRTSLGRAILAVSHCMEGREASTRVYVGVESTSEVLLHAHNLPQLSPSFLNLLVPLDRYIALNDA